VTGDLVMQDLSEIAFADGLPAGCADVEMLACRGSPPTLRPMIVPDLTLRKAL
jgi:hypothetical protein